MWDVRYEIGEGIGHRKMQLAASSRQRKKERGQKSEV
jgi:hypothetical protein